MLVEQDTEEAALRGKLGQSESAVQETFRRMDRLVSEILGTVDRRPIRRGGEWTGRSYRLGRKLLLRVDAKVAFLRVWVGADGYAAAPSTLTGSYHQDEWLIVRPVDLDVALPYVAGVLRSAEAGGTP